MHAKIWGLRMNNIAQIEEKLYLELQDNLLNHYRI